MVEEYTIALAKVIKELGLSEVYLTRSADEILIKSCLLYTSIVTTIQKLNNLMKSEADLPVYNQQVVFIFDEAHRSQSVSYTHLKGLCLLVQQA